MINEADIETITVKSNLRNPSSIDRKGIGANTKVIVSAGRLDKQKGFKYLIDAAKLARDQQKDWKFFIAGTGKQHDFLLRLINTHNLQDYFFLLGFQEGIYSLLPNADVFVLPSLYEGMPNVLLEAMQKDTPVVTTPVNGAQELVKDNVNGLYIIPADGEDIFNKLEKILSDKALEKSLIRNAKQTVADRFTLEISIQNIENYLKALLKE